VLVQHMNCHPAVWLNLRGLGRVNHGLSSAADQNSEASKSHELELARPCSIRTMIIRSPESNTCIYCKIYYESGARFDLLHYRYLG